MSDITLSTRGRHWFEALSGKSSRELGHFSPKSVLNTDAMIGDELARFLCVVPDPSARFPMVREGEVGLEEAYALASYVKDAIDSDADQKRRPIIAIVDVKSQAYGRREETAAIYHAAATCADAYATARVLGHPVITLVVGQALSGGFLTHGYQANRILAIDDPGVVIHAMHKESAARVTKRTCEELDKLAETILPLSYDIKDFAKLGILHELLHVHNIDEASPKEVAFVRERLIAAIEDARISSRDLNIRWQSPAAIVARKATIETRKAMYEQWDLN